MLDTEGNSALAELGRATSSLQAVLFLEREAAGYRCIFIQIKKGEGGRVGWMGLRGISIFALTNT